MKKNCCVCGERGRPWKAILLEMLGLGRLGNLYCMGALMRGAGGIPLVGRYEVLLLLVALLELLVTTPCLSSVSMEKPKDWDLFMLKGEANGPQLKGALRKGMPAWLARVVGIEELGRLEAPVTVGGSAREPCCIKGWL